ncbi:MAG: hypothetical protein ACR2O1_12790 [Boseongicola sp.]
MPLQNRVLATGEIVAHPARGLFMGNRGILHDDEQQLGTVRWRHKAWVTCVLQHKDWHREVMMPGNYTELFFLDEAVALAAGHRPCALCRRDAYNAFREAAGFRDSAKAMDEILHAARAIPRRFEQCRTDMEIDKLPVGAMILHGVPKLVLEDRFLPVAPDGYGSPEPRPTSGNATVLTPAPTIEALREGYRPTIHSSAGGFVL